jgi:hypothetical protein
MKSSKTRQQATGVAGSDMRTAAHRAIIKQAYDYHLWGMSFRRIAETMSLPDEATARAYVTAYMNSDAYKARQAEAEVTRAKARQVVREYLEKNQGTNAKALHSRRGARR